MGGLLFIFLLDLPLGSFPVAIRFLAPSAHVRTLAAISAKVSLPLPMAVPEGTLLVSALTLLVLGLASAWLSVWIFRNRDLGALA